MKRLVIKGLLLLVFAALCWYFFIKDEHVRIRFSYNEPPAIVLQNLKQWHTIDHEGMIISDPSNESEGAFIRNLTVNDSSFQYIWKIRGTREGGSKVSVEITDTNNYYKQKLQPPFLKNDFVKRSLKTVTTITDAFKKRAENYRVHNIKDSIRKKEFCAYIPVASTTTMKATDMLSNIGIVMDYLKGNEIELTGDPFLEVKAWNRENDSIRFDFCFPIAKRDSFPPTELIKFRNSMEFDGLKAEFNGNYRESDRAWHYLLDKAKRDGLKVRELPVEIFLNDPHAGGNPLDWKAIIYLPLDR